jgi:hypothetical protein
MRSRLVMIGQESDVANRFSGHYKKRISSVLPKIGMHAWIMNRIYMTGEGTYTRYTEMFNDATQVYEPTFSNVHAAVEWAAARARTGIDKTLNYGDDDSEDE